MKCTYFSKVTLSLICLLFFVISIITSVILAKNNYNTAPTKDWVLVGGLRSDGATFRVRTPTSSEDPSNNERPQTFAVSSSSDDQDESSIVYSADITAATGDDVGDGNDSESPVETVTITGLDSSAEYHYWTKRQDGTIMRRGRFQTPAPDGTRFDFKIATAGCAMTGSKSDVFNQIAEEEDLFLFVHLGDFHYENLNVDSLNVRIDAVDKVLGSTVQANVFSQAGLAYMWDDHDWLGDESSGSGVGREAALESYRVAFPYHDPLPAASSLGTTTNATSSAGYSGVPAYHAFTIGTVRFIISDLRSESSTERIYSDAQKDWLFDEISKASSFDFVVWVTPSPWIGKAKEDDTWWGHPEERAELSEYITQTIGGVDGPQNLIALSADAHMMAFDDGRNTYYGQSSTEQQLSSDDLYSFPILQSGPLDRPGSAKGGPYSDGCYTFKNDRTSQYSTLAFQFSTDGNDDGEEEGACIHIKSFRAVGGPSKETIFSKSLCGKIFTSTDTAGTGSCDGSTLAPASLALVIASAVFAFIAITMAFCFFDSKCEALQISLLIALAYVLTYVAGIGIPLAMGLQYETVPIAIIVLLEMLTICIYLFCWNKKDKTARHVAKDGDGGGEESKFDGEE